MSFSSIGHMKSEIFRVDEVVCTNEFALPPYMSPRRIMRLFDLYIKYSIEKQKTKNSPIFFVFCDIDL